MQDYILGRNYETPITPEQLQPLDARCRCVQFSRPLSEADHQLLAGFLRQYPHVWLRAYGPWFKNFDLDFLRHYPFVRHLEIDVLDLANLDGLQHVSPELESFGLGETKRKAHSFSFLQRFPRLRTLHLEGHTKDIDVIGALSQLEKLTLRSITLPDLSVLRPLKQLRALEIKLGGTKKLDLLPEIGKLRYLELWMIRGLTDLGPIASVRTLQFLFLQALKNVAVIPSLAGLPLLRRIHLHTMKGLTDLRPGRGSCTGRVGGHRHAPTCAGSLSALRWAPKSQAGARGCRQPPNEQGGGGLATIIACRLGVHVRRRPRRLTS